MQGVSTAVVSDLRPGLCSLAGGPVPRRLGRIHYSFRPPAFPGKETQEPWFHAGPAGSSEQQS